MNIEIIQATMGDVKRLIELLTVVTKNLHKKDIQQWTLPINKHLLIEEIINEQIYIVLVDHQLVGTFGIEQHTSQVSLLNKESLYLYRIALHPNFQKTGLGKELVNFACSYACEQDKPIYLDCWNQNHKLKQFYKRCGFTYGGDIQEEDYFVSVYYKGRL